MTQLKAFKVVEGVYWVGARDVGRRLFDSLIPLPRGTSYNAYLVIGSREKALIDTVNPGFERDLISRVGYVADLAEVSYVIMNHAEPDHAGAIPTVLSLAPGAKLITTAIGARMAKMFYSVPDDRIQAVKDGSSIDLGGKTLRFIEAPMLHWPETMFTYLVEDKVLFPCDFFGAHLAQGVWDDEVEDILVHAQRYFGEIMMPFRSSALNALKKVADLDVKVVAPSHGPIYRSPRRIIDRYWTWARGETREKVLVAYVSAWRYTEKVAKAFTDELSSEGVEAAMHDLTVADLGDLAKDLVDSRAIAMATPTIVLNAHPLAVQAAYLAKLLRAPAKYAALITVYAWGSTADKQLAEMLKDAGMELVGTVKINVTPTEKDNEGLRTLARTLAKKLKGSGGG
ncbi:MAG: FprA family A-type flavoprotein [Candidatus Nezhaarchaeota archaeon]|nr:FprA family A-type flavoprotein [Candidatus Nezhaarchaeota archaeon]